MGARDFFMLQHARAMSLEPPLWQLSAQYASDLVADGGSAAPAAREHLSQLVLSQQAPHLAKLRKLLGLCEAHSLRAEASALLERTAAAKRASRLAATGGKGPAASALQPSTAVAAKAKSGSHAPAAPATAESHPLARLASAALDEALRLGEGPATSELRAVLRCEGVGGAQYYAGPRWLPPFFALAQLIAQAGTAQAAAQAAAGIAAAAPGAAPGAAQGAATAEAGWAREAIGLVLELASSRRDPVGDGLPEGLMLRLLGLLAGEGGHAAAHEPLLLRGSAQTGGAPASGSRESYALLAEFEALRGGGALNPTPAEAQPARYPETMPHEQARVSKAITENLAAAILAESAAEAQGWGEVASAP